LSESIRFDSLRFDSARLGSFNHGLTAKYRNLTMSTHLNKREHLLALVGQKFRSFGIEQAQELSEGDYLAGFPTGDCLRVMRFWVDHTEDLPATPVRRGVEEYARFHIDTANGQALIDWQDGRPWSDGGVQILLHADGRESVLSAVLAMS
jgi:hypothetical protein